MSTNSQTQAPTVDPFLTDHNFRHEARKAFNAHLKACHEEMKQAGVTPPEWPKLDDNTISGLAANMLWLQRWIFSFNAENMKLELLPISMGAYILTSQQIQKNIEEILPGYRLIERPVYDQLTEKQEDHFLQVDFSHRICYGNNPDAELIQTLKSDEKKLYGIFGALIHLLKTSEENKLGASIAECFDQELMALGSILDSCSKTGIMDSDTLKRIQASVDELDKANGFLIEVFDESKNDKFGLSLTMIADEKLNDIRALIYAYEKQSPKAEQAEEQAVFNAYREQTISKGKEGAA